MTLSPVRLPDQREEGKHVSPGISIVVVQLLSCVRLFAISTYKIKCFVGVLVQTEAS